MPRKRPAPKDSQKCLVCSLMSRWHGLWQLFTFSPSAGSLPSRFICPHYYVISLVSNQLTPGFELLVLSFLQLCAARLGDGCLIESEDHEFFHGFCLPWLRSDCCLAGNRCFRSRLVLWDAQHYWESETARYSNSCRVTSRTSAQPSRDWSGQWAVWEAFSLRFSSVSSGTGSALFGPVFCSCPWSPVSCGGSTHACSCHKRTNFKRNFLPMSSALPTKSDQE